MSKIKNKYYKQFLEEGNIETINEDHIIKAIENVKGKYGKYIKELRSCIICAYYTGARPNELLRIKSKHVRKRDRYVMVKIKASKGGLPRTVYLPFRRKLVKEFWGYCCTVFDDMYLFYHYQTSYKRVYKKKNGEIIERFDISDGLRHHFKKAFTGVLGDGITPYFLRHNRFSKLSEAGATMEELRQIKGCRSAESIVPYIHLSSNAAKKTARKME